MPKCRRSSKSTPQTWRRFCSEASCTSPSAGSLRETKTIGLCTVLQRLTVGMQPDNKEVQEFILFVMPKVNNLIAESKLQLVQRDNERCLLNVKRGLDMCPHS